MDATSETHAYSAGKEIYFGKSQNIYRDLDTIERDGNTYFYIQGEDLKNGTPVSIALPKDPENRSYAHRLEGHFQHKDVLIFKATGPTQTWSHKTYSSGTVSVEAVECNVEYAVAPVRTIVGRFAIHKTPGEETAYHVITCNDQLRRYETVAINTRGASDYAENDLLKVPVVDFGDSLRLDKRESIFHVAEDLVIRPTALRPFSTTIGTGQWAKTTITMALEAIVVDGERADTQIHVPLNDNQVRAIKQLYAPYRPKFEVPMVAPPNPQTDTDIHASLLTGGELRDFGRFNDAQKALNRARDKRFQAIHDAAAAQRKAAQRIAEKQKDEDAKYNRLDAPVAFSHDFRVLAVRALKEGNGKYKVVELQELPAPKAPGERIEAISQTRPGAGS